MTVEELKDEIMLLIDEEADSMSKEEYDDFLADLISDLRARRDALEEDD